MVKKRIRYSISVDPISNFRRFLRANGAARAFDKAASNDRNSSYVSLSTIPVKSFVSSAFMWSQTEDGWAYWEEINTLWNSTLAKVELEKGLSASYFYLSPVELQVYDTRTE